MTTRADILVLLFSFFLVVSLYPLLWQPHEAFADTAELSARSSKRLLALDQDGVYRIEGFLGETIVEVSEKKIRVLASPCSNKQCIRSGWLQKVGEFSACLPNGVSLFLLGDDRYDSINF
ncbi:MAG: NusG domain II-containing protein [Gammaproteobacteria bacterium]|nr:NusG domain II-containing protein [Gammaproteobacteria bacterium]MDH5692247.1 NusG domain II-containing protein [Gammaproteobacteria bacterium]